MSDNSTKAASNGDIAPSKPAPAQREHGMSRLREEECYYLTNLAQVCLNEAEHLIRKIQNKVSNRVFDHDGSKGTRPMDDAEVTRTLDEAYDCAALALTYLFSVSLHLKDDRINSEPPF
jgi:hypothetical protein